MTYVHPYATLLILESEDAITASFTKTEIKTGNYAEQKDTITFEDLVK